MSEEHKKLENIAIEWLYSNNCSLFAQEVPVGYEIADALGIKTQYGINTIYYIEAKVSKSDLMCKKQKLIYRKSVEYNKDIDFYYLIVSDTLIIPNDIYPKWGVINSKGKVIRRAKRFKKKSNGNDLIIAIAHKLVYKVFGKMYL